MLGRDTRWRQGCLLTSEAAQELTLIDAGVVDRHAVVITHDCDMQNDQELLVELINASQVAAIDPVYANARHPRLLHLPFQDDAGSTIILALRHDGRQVVNKEALAALGEQALGKFILDAAGKRILKQWLAARYARPAFPNAFENRLRRKVSAKITVEKAIGRLLGQNHQYLAGLFVDLDDKRHVELGEGVAYPLSLQVVYHAVLGEVARRTAEDVASQLETLFLNAYGQPENAPEICLERCEAVADTSISLADLQKIDQWRLEYFSLEADPQEHFVGLGELGL